MFVDTEPVTFTKYTEKLWNKVACLKISEPQVCQLMAAHHDQHLVDHICKKETATDKMGGAPVAQRVKPWPTELAVPGSIPV